MYVRHKKTQKKRMEQKKKYTKNFGSRIEKLKKNLATFSRLHQTVKPTFNLKVKENLARFNTLYVKVNLIFNLKCKKVTNKNKFVGVKGTCFSLKHALKSSSSFLWQRRKYSEYLHLLSPNL
jgi:hypothetical protein